MVNCTLKIRLSREQEKECERFLYHLSSVWNWAIRKIELNAKDGVYFRKYDFMNLLSRHGKKIGIPSHTIQEILETVYASWDRCFSKKGGKPKFKGKHNKLVSIPFPDPIKPPKENRIGVPGLGKVKFYKQNLPEGKIKCGRIIKKSSGWYLCLWIDAEPKEIKRTGYGEIGIDPGFKSLLTTSEGKVFEHPRELEKSAKRLAQAQRGHDKKLASRVQERISNQRKDRNHKISRQLVSENVLIAWSKDNTKGMSKKFGKSVTSSGHAQLRGMLAYKSPKSGTQFIEVASKNSTRTCSECGCLSGPTGFAGLSVRHWSCPCGAEHDRDVNAARNTLFAAAGCAVNSGILPEEGGY